jgi:hypothetical protein
MSGTLVTEINSVSNLKKNKSWPPIMPKQRERCLVLFSAADNVNIAAGHETFPRHLRLRRKM